MGAFTKLSYQVIFSTKYRQPLIRDAFRERLYEYIGGTIRALNGHLIEVGGIEDHVHLLANFPPTIHMNTEPGWPEIVGGRHNPAQGDSVGSIETFETTRLLAERISEVHFEDLCRLHRDPDVMRTLTADGRPLSDDATRDRLRAAIENWDRQGFDLWVFRDKASGTVIGRGGLRRYDVEGRMEVGLAYAVLSEFWNQGFATEMAAAGLRIGFERLGFTEIASWALPHNTASLRVMEKLGFQYERDITFAGLIHRYYRLSASDWRASCAMDS
jgi:[ribosomal protein S5]-alanine N-acetyltransferase